MISAAEMTEAASMRAAVSLRPQPPAAPATSLPLPRLRRCDHRDARRRDQALQRHLREYASTITTTNERRLPRPSSTSAREPQPFDSTMP